LTWSLEHTPSHCKQDLTDNCSLSHSLGWCHHSCQPLVCNGIINNMFNIKGAGPRMCSLLFGWKFLITDLGFTWQVLIWLKKVHAVTSSGRKNHESTNHRQAIGYHWIVVDAASDAGVEEMRGGDYWYDEFEGILMDVMLWKLDTFWLGGHVAGLWWWPVDLLSEVSVDYNGRTGRFCGAQWSIYIHPIRNMRMLLHFVLQCTNDKHQMCDEMCCVEHAWRKKTWQFLNRYK
jgi:hypothetical protein